MFNFYIFTGLLEGQHLKFQVHLLIIERKLGKNWIFYDRFVFIVVIQKRITVDICNFH